MPSSWAAAIARNGVFVMRIWGITHRGRVRIENQDAYHFILPAEGPAIGVVCDGMGGARGGNVASEMAVNCFLEHLRPDLPKDVTEDVAGDRMRAAAVEANRAVYQRALEDPMLRGMGTTIVAAVVLRREAVVLNVGDSRAYHMKKGVITRITSDHSVVEDMVRRGKITREEARYHPQKNLITRALGSEASVDCDLFTVPVEKGEYLLLCSDGLTNTVMEEELLEEVYSSHPPDTCCDRLLAMSLARGAPDNVTVVLFEL